MVINRLDISASLWDAVVVMSQLYRQSQHCCAPLKEFGSSNIVRRQVAVQLYYDTRILIECQGRLASDNRNLKTVAFTVRFNGVKSK